LLSSIFDSIQIKLWGCSENQIGSKIKGFDVTEGNRKNTILSGLLSIELLAFMTRTLRGELYSIRV